MVLDVLIAGTARFPLLDGSTITLDGGEGVGEATLTFSTTSAFRPAVDDAVVVNNINLLKETERFDNAAWTDFFTPVVTANDTTDPLGGMTADKIEDNHSGTNESLYQDITIANDGATYTVSCYFKQGTAAKTQLVAYFTGGVAVAASAVITWSGPTTNYGTLTDVGAGWYRLEFQATNNTTGNTNLRWHFYPSAPPDITPTGTCFAWGAQLEAGATVSPYSPRYSGKREIFTGTIVSISEDHNGKAPGDFVASCQCVSAVWKMNRRVVSKIYAAQSDRAILQDLLVESGLDSDITAPDATVDIIDSTVTIGWSRETLRNAFDEIAEHSNARWALDGASELHFNVEANATDAPWDVDESPDDKTGFSVRDFKIERSWENPINQVTVIGGDDDNGVAVTATATDATSIINHGIYEATIENKNLSTAALCQAVADTAIAVNKEPGFRGNYSTFRDGLEPNMLQTLDSSTFNFTAEPILIRRVSIEQRSRDITNYEVEFGAGGPSAESLARLLESTTVRQGPLLVRGLDFDGSNDAVTVANDTTIEDLGDLTMSVYVKFDDLGTLQTIWQKGTTSFRWAFELLSSGQLIFKRGFSSSNRSREYAPTLNTTQIYHLAVTYDSSVSSALAIKFYLDGVEQESVANVNGSGSNVADTGDTLHIGEDDASGQRFNGVMFDFLVWDKLLTTTWIQRLASKPRVEAFAGVFDTNRVLALRMNDDVDGASAGTLLDVSGNVNDGTAAGGPTFKEVIWTPPL